MPLSSAHYKTQPLIIFVGVLLVLLLLTLAIVRERPSWASTVAALGTTVAFGLPVLPYLTFQEEPFGMRYLYLAGAGYVILGSIYLRQAFQMGRSSGAWIIVGLTLAVAVGTLRHNLRLWRQTGRVTQGVLVTLDNICDRAPKGALIELRDWPLELDGVPFPRAKDFEAILAARKGLDAPRVRFLDERRRTEDDPRAYRAFSWSMDDRWLQEEPP